MKLNEFSYLQNTKIFRITFQFASEISLTKVFRNEIKLNKKEFDFKKKMKTP